MPSDAEGTRLVVTGGADRFAIRSGETRWVVLDDIANNEQRRPMAAEVTIYDAQLGADDPRGPQSDPEAWAVEDWHLNCDTGVLSCEGNGDVVLERGEPQRDVAVHAVIHEGSASGPIVGVGREFVDAEALKPSRPAPVSIRVTVLANKQDASFAPVFYVESFGNGETGSAPYGAD